MASPSQRTDPTLDAPRDSATARRSASTPASSARRSRHGRVVGWRSRDVVRVAALVMAMYLVARLVWFASALFLILFLGILFAIAVSAGVDRLQRLRVPRGIGAALIVVAFFALLGAFGATMAPILRSQGRELRQKLPLAVDRLEEWVNRRENGVFGVLLSNPDSAASPAGHATARPAVPSPTAPVVATRDTTAASRDSTRPAGTTLRERIADRVPGMTRYLFPFLTGTLQVLSGTLLIVFLAIYLAADPDLYRRGLLALLPRRKRGEAAEVMDRVAIVLRKWLLTQLVAMLVIGTVSTVALLLLGVKAAFALGILAGLFEFIPTVGPTLSAVPAIGMAFLDSPEKAVLVLAAYVAIQFLENHILIPLLMKGGIDLPPALTVLTQALLALVFGFLGLMVAVPLLATIVVLVQILYVEKREPGAPSHEAEFDPDLDEPLTGLLARSG